MMEEKAHIAWTVAYQPRERQDFVGNEDAMRTLQALFDSPSTPDLLLHGPSGSGKTSSITYFLIRYFDHNAAEMQRHVMTKNASNERGIELIRTSVRNFLDDGDTLKRKFIVLDEADSIINEAQATLRRVMEQYSRVASFILLCNYPSKLLPAIRSRCVQFTFRPLPPPAMQHRLEHIATKEQIAVESRQDVFYGIVHAAQGDMRRAINLLQACSMFASGAAVTPHAVETCSNYPSPSSVASLWRAMQQANYEDIQQQLHVWEKRHITISYILHELAQRLLHSPRAIVLLSDTEVNVTKHVKRPWRVLHAAILQCVQFASATGPAGVPASPPSVGTQAAQQ